jgi:tetratricopeptide (TPR) repeat protein
MAIIQLFPEDRVLFGTNIPADIDHCLQQAVQAYEDTAQAEQLLWQAQRLDPKQLEVYIALYKFYFYKYRLKEAEKVTQLALEMCATVGNFPANWRELTLNATDWTQTSGAARIYLYTLKALSFIRLRQMQFNEAEQLLDKLAELDPQDQVGSSVLREVAAGMRGETA